MNFPDQLHLMKGNLLVVQDLVGLFPLESLLAQTANICLW